MQASTVIEERRSTPVRLECDVLVCGGGTAGVIAAIAAARTGARTILVERYGTLGGTMINGAGPLHSFFNLYKAFPNAKKIQLVRGIPQETVDRLTQAGGCLGHREMQQGYAYDSIATIIDREIYKDVSLRMLEEAGVKLLLHALVVDAVKDGDHLKGVIIESKSGREALLARVVIDTTGDADVAARAGAACINTYPDAQVGMPFGLTNVNLNTLVAYLESKAMVTQLLRGDKGSKSDDVIRVGFELKKLPVFKEYMESTGMWGPLTVSRHEGDFSFINTANLKPLDAIDVEELTRGESELRRQVTGMADLMKKHLPGCENAYLSWTPIQFGVRRTRIVECEYDISLEELVNCRHFEDDVVHYGFHDLAPRIMIKDGGSYGIPYRALLPKKIENLLVAGRLITSNWEAHMSTRNTVSCMAQGQAVGTAAALSALQGIKPRALDVTKLQLRLCSDGAYLGDIIPSK